MTKRRLIKILLSVVTLLAIAGGAYYWFYARNIIFTDKAEISAPLVDISAEKGGILKELYVKEGNLIPAYFHIARLDNDQIISSTSGLVVTVNKEIGKFFAPGSPIVSLINPKELRVIAKVEETNDFESIKIGQKVRFTVDAFGSKDFYGTIEEIASTSLDSSAVFTISDKREAKQFVIKIKYDLSEYPELLNGMSARVWIYKQ